MIDGYRVLDAIEAAKGCAITDKVSRSGKGNKPGIMTISFSDQTSVSFPRAKALKLENEEQLAAFVRGLF